MKPDSDKKPPKPLPLNTQGAHNRTLSTTKKAAPDAGFVKPGGHSDLGKPIDKQNFGKKAEEKRTKVPFRADLKFQSFKARLRAITQLSVSVCDARGFNPSKHD